MIKPGRKNRMIREAIAVERVATGAIKKKIKPTTHAAKIKTVFSDKLRKPNALNIIYSP